MPPDPHLPQAVEVINLTVVRSGRTVVDRATWGAATGAITALLGRNGAGKTTTVEAIVGVRPIASGDVCILGFDPRTDQRTLRARVGWMPQEGGAHQTARPLEALAHRAAMYDTPWPVAQLCERLGIAGPWVRSPLRRLSGGEAQRVRVALALVGRPDVVFLDEPTNGLDLDGRALVWETLEHLRGEGVAVVISSHLLDDIERHADHVVVIDDGRIVAAGATRELLSHNGSEVSFSTGDPVSVEALSQVLPVDAVVREAGPGRYVVSGPVDAETLNAVAAWCRSNSVRPTALALGTGSLESFVRAVSERSPR